MAFRMGGLLGSAIGVLLLSVHGHAYLAQGYGGWLVLGPRGDREIITASGFPDHFNSVLAPVMLPFAARGHRPGPALISFEATGSI